MPWGVLEDAGMTSGFVFKIIVDWISNDFGLL